MKLVLVVGLGVLAMAAGPARAQTPGASSPAAGPFSLSAEALVWWLKGSPAPVPLVTDGLVGEPGTKTYLGGRDIDTNPNPGLRVTAGYALSERWGVEASAFYLPSSNTRNEISSSGQPGSPELRIPYVSLGSGEAAARLSAGTLFAGYAAERLENSLLGAELNGSMKLASTARWRVDALAGLRYLRLRETYSFDTSSPNIPPRPSDVWLTRDEFDATNSFYGPQLGVRARADWGGLFLNGVVKVGVGAIVQSVHVTGLFTTNDFNNFGDPETFVGGYFTSPLSAGSHSRTVVGVIPEVGLNAGWRITPWASVFAGYTFLYANNVARPGNQIDRVVDLDAGTRPQFKFKGSDFWAQGVNVGLAFQF
jgi:hypothetical protein